MHTHMQMFMYAHAHADVHAHAHADVDVHAHADVYVHTCIALVCKKMSEEFNRPCMHARTQNSYCLLKQKTCCRNSQGIIGHPTELMLFMLPHHTAQTHTHMRAVTQVVRLCMVFLISFYTPARLNDWQSKNEETNAMAY